jgi:hypothetical protein
MNSENGLPPKITASWKEYSFWGESDGLFQINGISSKSKSPDVVLEGNVKGGGFNSGASRQEVKNINLDFKYQSRDGNYHQQSSFHLLANKKVALGDDLQGELMIVNLDKPVMDISLKAICLLRFSI